MTDPIENNIVPPAPGSSVIFFHGLGGNGEEWVSRLSRLVPKTTKLICPTASCMDVTRFSTSMAAWFDFPFEDIMEVGDPANLKKSSEYMVKLIETEIERGVPPHKIVIGGFSQGGAVSFYTGVNCPYKIGGAVVLSAWLPCYKEIIEDSEFQPNTSLKLFIAHGDGDKRVDISYMQKSVKVARRLKFKPHVHIYPSLDHQTCKKE